MPQQLAVMEIFVKIHYSQFVLHLGSHACILIYDNIIFYVIHPTNFRMLSIINTCPRLFVIYNNVVSIDNIRIVCVIILFSKYTCIICIIVKCSVNTFV